MKNHANKIILAFLILQTIAGIILAIFAYNFLTNRDVQLNRAFQDAIQATIRTISPLKGETGDTGEVGEQGPRGFTGDKGDMGDKGDQGDMGVEGQQGSQGLSGLNGESIKGDKGDKGDTGETGSPAPLAQFQCNPELMVWEYRYSADEDWMVTNGRCIPVIGENNAE